MSLSRGRKKRKESGLRRIFERSVKELKTEAHPEEEEWPSLPPATQTSHPAADFLQQGGKTTDDRSKEGQWEEEKSVPETAKDTKVYSALEDEPKTEDSKKKSESNNELQLKDNVLTSRKIELNTDFPAVEEKESTRDSQGRKTLSKISDKWEREKPRGSRESRHTLKENTVGRIKEETKRSRSNELKNKRDTSSTSRASESRGPVNRRRDSDGRGRRERERRKARERRLSRSSGRRKEAKVVRPETSRLSKSECEDDKRNGRDQQEGGVVEDWMNELLDVPYLDPTEIIIPTEKVLQESRSYRKRFQNNKRKASNLTFHEKRDQLESIQVSGNSMDDSRNLDNCKEQISEMAVEISTDNNGNQSSGLVLQFEEEWECQEIPNETIKLEEDKFLSTVKTDLELTESVIETIVEERFTLNKETSAQGKSNPTCDMHKIKTEDSDELIGNTKDEPEIRETDQTSEKNSQGQLSSQTESEDRLCVMVSKDTQGKEKDFTKDGDCKNISNMETTNNAGKISKEDQNKQCEEECNRESSDSLASSVSSKPVMSSVEDWSSEYLDSEEHSDTYHKILQDKIVALKSRIPMKMSTSSHRGQERDLGCRGRHRQRDGPFQSYLKTIHFEDGKNIDQSNNADNCAIIGAEFNNEYVQTTEEEKNIAPTGENFLANKMEEDHHSSVCTKKNSEGESKWPSRPPGFIISLPSHSLDDIEQLKPSPATLFHKNIQNTVETLEKCEKLYGSISREHKGESMVEVSSLSATFQGLDLDSTFEEKRVIKDFKNSDELTSNGENWENSLYDVDTMDLRVSRKEMSDVAVVPDVNVGNLGKKSAVEHCVPEDQEALDSSVESCSFPHFSNRICDSQNTLNGIPTISEYENSVKEEDLVSQYEDSLEDIGHQSPPQSEFIPNEEETSSSCSKSSRQNYEHFRHEERRLENRKKVLERRKDARYGLKCHCPADCVQFWVWRSCLCQDPYLYSIQSGTDGHPAKNVISYGPYEEERRPRSNSLSITPDESGKVLEEEIDSRQALQEKENLIRNRDLSSDSLFSPHGPRELRSLRTAARSGREQDECSGLDQNNSSNGAEDNESLELSDEDSGDRCSAESPTSEDADIPEYSTEREQENSVPYQYLASYPPVMNYMGYPPGYGFYPPYPAAYPGAQAALGRRYPGPYPEPFDPYPPAYLSGRYSRQQCVDGQIYPDHPGYLPAMFYPHFMMVDGWRETSLHHGEPHLGFIPRYVYPSSHEGHESSTGRCRRESESHASNSREVGHGSIAEDAGHHHNIVDCHHNLKKKPKDTAGRGVSKVSSTLTEELPSKNVYIPPHRRVPNVHGQYVARENRPTNNKDISPPSSHLYQNCKETPRTWRDERSHMDGSFDIGSSEVSYWRTQQNRFLSCPTTSEHNSNAQNIKRSFASTYYELHQQQDGQGQHTVTELSQSGNASEDEPSGCDLFLASSSEDSTPTSRPYRFKDQRQTLDRYPESVTQDWRSALLERCNVYGVGYIDSHCHIDFLFNRLDFKGRWSDFQVQNMKTFPSSYLGCVAVFCNPNSFKQEGLWRSLSKEENVWLTFGCHPKNARDFTKWNLEGLRKCLLHSRVVALGEIGLDYSGVFVETKELQKSVFKKQIRMALDMRKPLVIHCREAEEDCLDILKQMVPRCYKIHCHCFTGDFTSAKLWLDHFPNLYIGLTPLVTYRTAKGARDVAKFIPLKRLLLESDAPYFVPRTIPKESMNYSHPGLCVTVAEEVARLKNISVQEVLKACLENTRDMYKI